jgi:hypothetical protein
VVANLTLSFGCGDGGQIDMIERVPADFVPVGGQVGELAPGQVRIAAFNSVAVDEKSCAQRVLREHATNGVLLGQPVIERERHNRRPCRRGVRRRQRDVDGRRVFAAFLLQPCAFWLRRGRDSNSRRVTP